MDPCCSVNRVYVLCLPMTNGSWCLVNCCFINRVYVLCLPMPIGSLPMSPNRTYFCSVLLYNEQCLCFMFTQCTKTLGLLFHQQSLCFMFTHALLMTTHDVSCCFINRVYVLCLPMNVLARWFIFTTRSVVNQQCLCFMFTQCTKTLGLLFHQ